FGRNRERRKRPAGIKKERRRVQHAIGLVGDDHHRGSPGVSKLFRNRSTRSDIARRQRVAVQIHKYCRTPDIVLQRRMSVSSGPDIYDRHFDRALRARHPTISTDIERAMDRAGNFAGCRALLPGWTELVSFEMRVVE